MTLAVGTRAKAVIRRHISAFVIDPSLRGKAIERNRALWKHPKLRASQLGRGRWKLVFLRALLLTLWGQTSTGKDKNRDDSNRAHKKKRTAYGELLDRLLPN
jgi:hypothetical protein